MHAIEEVHRSKSYIFMLCDSGSEMQRVGPQGNVPYTMGELCLVGSRKLNAFHVYYL